MVDKVNKVLNIRLPNDEVETVHVGDTAMKIMGVVKWIVRGFDAGHVQLATSMEGIAGFGIPFHEFAKEWVLISDDDEEDTVAEFRLGPSGLSSPEEK